MNIQGQAIYTMLPNLFIPVSGSFYMKKGKRVKAELLSLNGTRGIIIILPECGNKVGKAIAGFCRYFFDRITRLQQFFCFFHSLPDKIFISPHAEYLFKNRFETKFIQQNFF